jgi:hypothetical protein
MVQKLKLFISSLLHIRASRSSKAETDSPPRPYNHPLSWRQFVKRVAISHKRNVIFQGCVPERPKNDGENYKSTVLLPETKHTSNENMCYKTQKY